MILFLSVEEVRITADHGSGMRLFINSTWVLAGVVSSEMKGHDNKTYTILTNAQPYILWIDGIMSSGTTGRTKRISERGTYYLVTVVSLKLYIFF